MCIYYRYNIQEVLDVDTCFMTLLQLQRLLCWFENNDLDQMRKKAVVTYFKVLPKKGLREPPGNLRQGSRYTSRDSNTGLPEYEAGGYPLHYVRILKCLTEIRTIKSYLPSPSFILLWLHINFSVMRMYANIIATSRSVQARPHPCGTPIKTASSVCLSVCTRETTWERLNWFPLYLTLGSFTIIPQHIPVLATIGRQ
jgi:hypothetical protein